MGQMTKNQKREFYKVFIYDLNTKKLDRTIS